jgi:hypothetical protein
MRRGTTLAHSSSRDDGYTHDERDTEKMLSSYAPAVAEARPPPEVPIGFAEPQKSAPLALEDYLAQAMANLRAT